MREASALGTHPLTQRLRRGHRPCECLPGARQLLCSPRTVPGRSSRLHGRRCPQFGIRNSRSKPVRSRDSGRFYFGQWVTSPRLD
ncbi:MAG: hypothetical protein QG597_5102, partial [Actinomycetota bacterium]|nr:hypothetical protein [Actinomycetota bacterium]